MAKNRGMLRQSSAGGEMEMQDADVKVLSVSILNSISKFGAEAVHVAMEAIVRAHLKMADRLEEKGLYRDAALWGHVANEIQDVELIDY